MITSSLAAFSGSKRLKVAAFTLLELLVVISIIAVLAGILLPVTGAVLENARKVEAKNTVAQIVTAVKSFQTDYGLYPVVNNGGAAPAADTTYTNLTNHLLFDILRAIDTPATSPNTRRTVYFEGKDVKNKTVPKSGFIPSGAGVSLPDGTLVDPWGNGYYVRCDTGYDDQVMLPEVDGGSNIDSAGQTGNTVLRFGIIAWSFGKDGTKGTNNTFSAASPVYGDDVVSWQ